MWQVSDTAMKTWLLVCVLLLNIGCATMPSIQYPMSWEDCSTNTLCTVSGIVTAKSSQGTWMGIMAFPDNRCISISLPKNAMADLRENGPRLMTVTGEVFWDPSTVEDAVWMEIEGREIGLGWCSDFFLFVS